MREIKFRCYDKTRNLMVYESFLINWNGELHNQQGNPNYVITQYTGRKDMNNKEIYEDDIIECEYYDNLPTTKGTQLVWRGVVKYYENHTHYSVSRLGSESGTYSVGFGGSAVKRYEVIGNIHENPDLTK